MSQEIDDAQKAAFLDRSNELLLRTKRGTLSINLVLDGLQKLVEGDFGNMVDLDANPYVPRAYNLQSHEQGGVFDFDPAKISLLQMATDSEPIDIKNYRHALKGVPVFNANLLDWLLRDKNKHLIPAAWAEELGDSGSIDFWGTIYSQQLDGVPRHSVVRSLCWDKRHKRWFQSAVLLLSNDPLLNNDRWKQRRVAVRSSS